MNRDVRDRLLLPIGIPLIALLVIAALVWSFSRILLLTSEEIGKEEAAGVALVAAVAILLGAGLISSYRRVPLASFAPIVALIFAAVVAGGIGAAVMSGEEAHEAAGEEAADDLGPPAVTLQIAANNLAFDQATLTAPPGVVVGIDFNNQEPVPHNVAVYTDASRSEMIFQGEIISGPRTILYKFTSPSAPGSYYFQCDVHPNMRGTFAVQ